MEHRLGQLAEPYASGRPAATGAWRRVDVAGGARWRRRAGAARRGLGALMVLAGSAAARLAVFKAGFASTRDPRYTVEPQRRRRRTGAQT